MDALTSPPPPLNERTRTYGRVALSGRHWPRSCKRLSGSGIELPMTINGMRRMGGGAAIDVVMPHQHRHVLGRTAQATHADVKAAIDAALTAAPGWRELPFDERAGVFLRAAQLLSTACRDEINAATMLGQSKSVQQAEIDAACELIDFLRFNVEFAHRIHTEQPLSEPGVWNRSDYRPLEGFVLAISPFNFTAIAGNLATAPALWATSSCGSHRRRSSIPPT